MLGLPLYRRQSAVIERFSCLKGPKDLPRLRSLQRMPHTTRPQKALLRLIGINSKGDACPAQPLPEGGVLAPLTTIGEAQARYAEILSNVVDRV
jgi:hypothetical protein